MSDPYWKATGLKSVIILFLAGLQCDNFKIAKKTEKKTLTVHLCLFRVFPLFLSLEFDCF